MRRLNKTAKAEVFLDDDIVDRSHDEANLCGVGSAGEVSVDLLGLVLVEADEAVEDVVAGGRVVDTALIVGEVVVHGADGQLLLEAINLVEEENDRCLCEPPRVADGVEQCQGFLHTVDGLIFEEQLIVLGDGDQEENGSDVLEAVDPLLTFGTLATNIEHTVRQVTNNECRFRDTSGLDTRAQHILVVGHVVRSGDTGDVIEVAISC